MMLNGLKHRRGEARGSASGIKGRTVVKAVRPALPRPCWLSLSQLFGIARNTIRTHHAFLFLACSTTFYALTFAVQTSSIANARLHPVILSSSPRLSVRIAYE